MTLPLSRLNTRGRRRAGAAFTPASLTALKAWYRADLGVTDAGAGAVSQWDDQSGNAHHLTEATNRPTYSATSGANGLAGITFDGTNDKLSCTFTALSQPFHCFIVAKLNAIENQAALVAGSTSSQRFLYTTTTDILFYFGAGTNTGAYSDTTNFNFFEFLADTTNSNYSFGSTVRATSTIGTGTLGGFILGQLTGFQFANGVISELILTSALVTGAELTNLRSYIASRYGLTTR